MNCMHVMSFAPEQMANHVVMRERRQSSLSPVRGNIASVLRPIIRSRDWRGCLSVCRQYGRNEREKAMRSPFRGTYPLVQNYRSGGISLFNRYFRIFDVLSRNCMSSFCDRIKRKELTVYSACLVSALMDTSMNFSPRDESGCKCFT